MSSFPKTPQWGADTGYPLHFMPNDSTDRLGFFHQVECYMRRAMETAPANASIETIRSVRRAYCASRNSGRFERSCFRRAINCVLIPLKYRYVCYIAGFPLAKSSHRSIEKFDLESAPSEPVKTARPGIALEYPSTCPKSGDHNIAERCFAG